MDEIAIFWKVLLAIAGGIIAVGGAITVLFKIKKPFDNMRESFIKVDEKYTQKMFEIELDLNEKENSIKEIRRNIDDEFKRADQIHDDMEREMRLYVDEKYMDLVSGIKHMESQITAMEKTIADTKRDSELILSALHSINNHLLNEEPKETLTSVNDNIFNHLLHK